MDKNDKQMVCEQASPDLIETRATIARADAQMEFDINRVERRIEEMNQMFRQMGAKLAQKLGPHLRGKVAQKDLDQAFSDKVNEKLAPKAPTAKASPKQSVSPKPKATVPTQKLGFKSTVSRK